MTKDGNIVIDLIPHMIISNCIQNKTCGSGICIKWRAINQKIISKIE